MDYLARLAAFVHGTRRDALPAATDFFLDFVIAKVSKHSCRSRAFLSIRLSHAIIKTGVIPLLRDYRFVYKKTKTCL